LNKFGEIRLTAAVFASSGLSASLTLLELFCLLFSLAASFKGRNATKRPQYRYTLTLTKVGFDIEALNFDEKLLF